METMDERIFTLTVANQNIVKSLANNIVLFTGGKFTLETVTILRTNDEKLAGMLDTCLETDLVQKYVKKDRAQRKFAEKECSDCHEIFIPTGSTQIKCEACRRPD
jgi:hypothetical protein